MLLSASVKRFGVSLMRDFFFFLLSFLLVFPRLSVASWWLLCLLVSNFMPQEVFYLNFFCNYPEGNFNVCRYSSSGDLHSRQDGSP